MRAPWMGTALAVALLAACGRHADTATVTLPVAPVVSDADRAQGALKAMLASRSIQEVPVHRDARADLDSDGTQDLLMLLDDPNWCNNDGCTLLVFHGEKDGYRLVTQTGPLRAPIAVGARINRGWHDLLVDVGSGDEAGTVALEYDGSGYPEDPTMAALLDRARLPSATPLLDAEMAPRIAAQ